MISSIITLLVGAAVFITGMNMMSSGLKKSTGKSVKQLFKKTQNNRIVSLGIGAGVTALVQSSAATSIMAIGFISTGVMTVFQGTSVILGAYIGTTVTGLLVSLSDVPFAEYLTLIAVIGVIMMFFKKELVKNIGEILTGLGLLFFGLETMKSIFVEGSQIMQASKDLFTAIKNPFLLLVVGAIFTALVQSSSATSGIVIVLVGTGAIQMESGFFLVLGGTIGTVITTILASIGGNVNVKRTAYMCLAIRILCAFIALAIVWPLQHPIASFFSKIFVSDELALAMFLVSYNIIFMFALLPFLKPIVNLFNKLIKDKDEEEMKKSLHFIDDRLLDSPDIAIDQVKKEIVSMLSLSYENFKLGFNEIINMDFQNSKTISNTETKIDFINNAITNYLIALSNKVGLKEESSVGSYFHVINDIERIGDHASNFDESAQKMKESDLQFSEHAQKEFKQMYDILVPMFDLTIDLFANQDTSKLPALHELEEKTDKLKLQLEDSHIDRIKNQKCDIQLSPFYSTLLSELERVADHLVNVGYALVNPTGDDE